MSKTDSTPVAETDPANDIFFAPETWETLFDKIEDAVRAHVEAVNGLTMEECVELSHWPVSIVEFRRAPKPTAEAMLDRVLEQWDEEYGDPAGNDTKPSPKMLSSMQSILDELTVWLCEETGRRIAVTESEAREMLDMTTNSAEANHGGDQ